MLEDTNAKVKLTYGIREIKRRNKGKKATQTVHFYILWNMWPSSG